MSLELKFILDRLKNFKSEIPSEGFSITEWTNGYVSWLSGLIISEIEHLVYLARKFGEEARYLTDLEHSLRAVRSTLRSTSEISEEYHETLLDFLNITDGVVLPKLSYVESAPITALQALVDIMEDLVDKGKKINEYHDELNEKLADVHCLLNDLIDKGISIVERYVRLKFCKNCGAMNPAEANFCGKCGAEL